MNIPKETVKEILDRVNIVELIGEYISLNKNGKNYQALCPFHNEKTPSFTVFAQSRRFQCFGCGEKGDAITFLMKKENLSYDAFRNRVMFPIQDAYGNVVAFGGRALGDGSPKYLNSAETPVFRKGQHLFGLHRAKEYGKEQLILCEGYMDVIALNSVGIMNAVATLGTALTVERAELLKKQTKRVLLNFDSDNAGQTATERALTIFEKIGLAAKVVSLDHAKDPDEYIKNFGKDAYIQALSESKNGFEFRMNRVLKKYDLSQIEEKIEAAKELVFLIAETDSAVTRDIYAHMVAERLEISVEAIILDILRMEESE